MPSPAPSSGGQRSERALCPVDPTHFEDAHAPGGAWFGVPHRYGDEPAGPRGLTSKLRGELVMDLESFVGRNSLAALVRQLDELLAAARAERG